MEFAKLKPYQFQKPAREVDTVFYHCSASNSDDFDNPQAIYDLHVNKNGWSDIGYHFYITRDGTIWVCRNLERNPAAQKGYNIGSIAVSLHGLHPSDFTEAQLKSAKELALAMDEACGGLRHRGHTEVANKLCPVFDYKRLLNLDADGNLGIGAGLKSNDFDHYPSTSLGDQGDSVFILQRLLNSSNADGVYGPQTVEDVKQYQEDIGLAVDGQAGPITWSELI